MPKDALTPPGFEAWIGRQTRAEDLVTERLVASFRAIFAPDLAPTAQGHAPLGIHWCLCPPIADMSALGADGHPAKNLDLPPIPLPRRMWAGGELTTSDALRVGDRVVRTSTIAGIAKKEGRSGELWFLTIEHDYATERGPALHERQDIVYREAARPGVAVAAVAQPLEPAQPHRVICRVATPTTLLFRYSAITFNGHRIHYDLPYATEAEGYAGLVVHGPIQATLLLNMAATHLAAPPRTLKYRGVMPAIAGGDLLVRAGIDDMHGQFWTEGPDGTHHMEATVVS